MKKYFLIIPFLFLILLSCKSKEEINPNSLVGKWVATGLTQSMNQDSTWSAWRVNPTFASVTPSIWEFTNNGKFFVDGKPGGSCCFAGNAYVTMGSKITFSQLEMDCSTVYCLRCNYWDYGKAGDDTLILRQCATKLKFVRVK